MVARRAHNPEVVGSNPSPATIQSNLGISMIPRFFRTWDRLVAMDPGELHFVVSSIAFSSFGNAVLVPFYLFQDYRLAPFFPLTARGLKRIWGASPNARKPAGMGGCTLNETKRLRQDRKSSGAGKWKMRRIKGFEKILKIFGSTCGKQGTIHVPCSIKVLKFQRL